MHIFSQKLLKNQVIKSGMYELEFSYLFFSNIQLVYTCYTCTSAVVIFKIYRTDYKLTGCLLDMPVQTNAIQHSSSATDSTFRLKCF